MPSYPFLRARKRAALVTSICVSVMALASLWASEQRATNRSGHGATGSTLSSHQSDITPTANITVTSTSDVANSTDGLCSLREAITAANGDVASGVLAGECVAGSSSESDTIDLSGVAGTISLTTALPDIGSGMTILGPGANILTVRRSTASGTPSFRIFNIQGSTVAISGMTISGGDLANAGGGAGILNSGGSLTLADSSVSFNRVTGLNTVGGGILNINNGSLTLTNSSVNANTAPTGGGIRSDSGTVKITNSTLSRNSSGAVSSRFTNLFLYNSTISDNSTGTNGNGAGVFADGGTMVVYNCTIAGNRTGFGGSGGGIFSDLGGQGSVFLRNNIIAQNTNQNTPSCAGTINHPRPCSPDLDGGFISQGHNLIGIIDTGACCISGPADRIGTAASPLIDVLKNNGGPTETRALLPGSPAIDAGDDCVALTGSGSCVSPPLSTDQRGMARVGTVDIGAFEAQGGFISFSQSNYAVSESAGFISIKVNRTNDTSRAVTVDYATDEPGASAACGTANGLASSRCDFTKVAGTLVFAAGEAQKDLTVLINRDSYVEGTDVFPVNLSNPTGGAILTTPFSSVVNISDDNTGLPPNAIDDAGIFVRMHYHDFLNREPDQSGLDFWTNQITSCGNDAQCKEVRRVDVSASFFLSIEFQQSGYLVERFYKSAYGDATGTSNFTSSHQLSVPVVRFDEFLKDTQRIGQGVIVLQPGWEQALENNKQAYALEFVQTSRFTTALPTTLTPDQFVDRLNQNTGGVLSLSERTAIVNLFGGAANSSNVTARAQAVRQVADDTDLFSAEYNRAFVLVEYFGYLRRNPNDAPDSDYTGYDFWLTKLNQFNGNYINAEMVKAFLSSIEYRQRFGP